MQIDLWDTSIQNAAINVLIQDLSDTAEIWTLEWGEIYEPAQEQVDVWKDIDDSLWYELNSVEIFNFDSVSAYNDLPSAVKKHSWYIQLHETDSVNTDSVTITTLNATDYLQKDSRIVLVHGVSEQACSFMEYVKQRYEAGNPEDSDFNAQERPKLKPLQLYFAPEEFFRQLKNFCQIKLLAGESEHGFSLGTCRPDS